MLLKESISLIKQDVNTKEIFSIEQISSSELKSIAGSRNNCLVDCDLDSVICFGHFGKGQYNTISSADGIFISNLLPVVAVDLENKILMQAFLNKEALIQTFNSGYANYFSRSRGKIWLKGESSNHKQEILRVEYSTEKSFFIYTVKQSIAACHEGYYSCFFRKLTEDGKLDPIDFDRKFIPDKVYG